MQQHLPKGNSQQISIIEILRPFKKSVFSPNYLYLESTEVERSENEVPHGERPGNVRLPIRLAAPQRVLVLPDNVQVLHIVPYDDEI